MIEKVLAFLGGTSIVAATICGFATLFGKVWVNRIFHKDRIRYEEQMQLLLTNLRNSGEKELHIHRLQFEKEFEVYSELWKRLLRVNRAASEFRLLSIGSSNPYDQQVNELHSSYNRLNETVFNNRPFYDPRVYDLTAEVLKHLGFVYRRLNDAAVSEKREEEIEQRIEAAAAAIPKVCDAIRDRIIR